MNKRKMQGFTLIEIIVVILMLGVLAAIAIPVYTGYLYKARAAEGIVFLGTVKTFAMGRKVETGYWPTKAQLASEFNNFNDLYYFDREAVALKPSDEPGAVDNIAIQLTASDSFGLSENFIDPTMQINISFISDLKKSGWSGGIVIEYAHHLPPCSDPL